MTDLAGHAVMALCQAATKRLEAAWLEYEAMAMVADQPGLAKARKAVHAATDALMDAELDQARIARAEAQERRESAVQ